MHGIVNPSADVALRGTLAHQVFVLGCGQRDDFHTSSQPGQFPPPVFSILVNCFKDVEALWKPARMDKKPSGSHQRRAFGDRFEDHTLCDFLYLQIGSGP